MDIAIKKIFKKLYPDYTETPNKYCWPYYGSYTTLDGAKEACSADSDCQAIYDASCNGSPYYLCSQSTGIYTSSIGSCLHHKGKRNFK